MKAGVYPRQGSLVDSLEVESRACCITKLDTDSEDTRLCKILGSKIFVEAVGVYLPVKVIDQGLAPGSRIKNLLHH